MIRGLARAILACVVGAALVLVAQALTWSSTRLPRATGGSQAVHVTGHQVEPGLRALGVALLVLSIALLASTGVLRRVAGLLTAVIGVAAVAVAVAGRGHTPAAVLHQAGFTTTPGAIGSSADLWWLVAAIGGVLCAAAGIGTAVFGGRWSTMSTRYDAPTAPPPEPAAGDGSGGVDADAAWKALDRGEDPTG